VFEPIKNPNTLTILALLIHTDIIMTTSRQIDRTMDTDKHADRQTN